MVETSMNIFDLGVLIIVGLSALLSFFRGFARELISLGAWLGAAVITLYAFPTVSLWLEPQVKSPEVAMGLATLGVFFVALISITIVTGTLFKFVKSGSDVGMLDNVVGLMFGAARGVLVVAIGYYMLSIVMKEDEYPEWVKQAESRPYVEKAADWVARAAPDYMEALKEPTQKADHATKENQRAAKRKLNRAADRMDEMGDDAMDSIPSFEELQRRVRDENARQ